MDTLNNQNLSALNSAVSKEGVLSRLDFLGGKWKTGGDILNEAGQVIGRVQGADTYELVSAGHFLLHRVDVMMGDTKTELIEIIGLDNVRGNAYSMRSFDNEGNFVTMTGKFERDGAFTIDGDGVRASLKYEKDADTINIIWEKMHDHSGWMRWIEMRLTR